MNLDFEPHICTDCGQTTEYIISIDRGTVDIVRAIAIAIGRKGVNSIHPRKEMERPKADVENGYLSSNQVGNLSRARFHGLIAALNGYPGNYCLTKKGARFLRGQAIPRYAIISKSLGKQIGYFHPEEITCKADEFKGEDEYWVSIGYDIVDGQVLHSKQLSTYGKSS